jgi:hypothetical protein
MRRVVIHSPIWSSRSVGIAEHLVKGSEKLEIEIDYTDQDGKRIYPDIYEMTETEAKQYPKQSFGNTPKLYIIPIIDLKPRELTEEELRIRLTQEKYGRK